MNLPFHKRRFIWSVLTKTLTFDLFPVLPMMCLVLWLALPLDHMPLRVFVDPPSIRMENLVSGAQLEGCV